MSIESYLSVLGSGSLLSENEVQGLCKKVTEILMEQPTVVQVQEKCKVVGDVHGQYYDLVKLLSSGSDTLWVFLGDYVDRGYHSVETICHLLVLKCLKSKQYILLRGNHETASLTRIYGFYDEVVHKYGNANVWHMLTEVFNCLPLCAVLCRTYFCVHGGLSPSTPLIQDIALLNRFNEIPETGAMSDLVWSDPGGTESEWTINNRGAGFLFSHQVTKEFLWLNRINTILRAHQLVQEGYLDNFGDMSCVTVWSAPNYCYRCGNQAAVAQITPLNQIIFVKFTSAEQTEKTKVNFEHILPYFL